MPEQPMPCTSRAGVRVCDLETVTVALRRVAVLIVCGVRDATVLAYDCDARIMTTTYNLCNVLGEYQYRLTG